jgi:methylthioribose-1-phosphate isomerase
LSASSATPSPATLAWCGDWRGTLELIDQTRLPQAIESCRCTKVEDVWDAIRQLRVRGAPAIGIAAAYGVVIGCQVLLGNAAIASLATNRAGHASEATALIEGFTRARAMARLEDVCGYLATSRPTAVNLFWALDRMRMAAATYMQSHVGKGVIDGAAFMAMLLKEAKQIHDEDRRQCAQMATHGAPLLKDCRNVLTHCNAGGLATSQQGTALGMVVEAYRLYQQLHVWVDETRPLLQGARLTAWELMQAGVPCTLVTDSMAGHLMQTGRVDAVVVGADRIAANGDAANKIGTYGLAVLARAHQLPFYVVAPWSTMDWQIDSGASIPIEQRGAEEITSIAGRPIAADGVAVYNPAFDVTPAAWITAIITDRGVFAPRDLRAQR